MEGITDLVYPRRCAVCDEVLGFGAGLVCGRHRNLPYVKEPCCMRCGKEIESEDMEYCADCERHSRSFDRVFPVFNYEEPVKSAVLAIKYHNKREYCEYYGECIANKLRPYVDRYALDGVAYVPVHKRKRRIRGYNQAELLSKVVSDRLGLPLLDGALIRTSFTTPQKELSNVQRANNLKQSMAVGTRYPDCRSIVLVDDIFTTGATADVCAGLLKEAGAQHVYCATVCIGGGR